MTDAVPVEPPPTAWELPDPASAGPDELVGVGADLAPGTLLAAYSRGLFPMPVRRSVGWWSPVRRGVIPLDGLRVSRSLRRSVRSFEVRVDTAFDEVVAGCADPRRKGRWITPPIVAAYRRLFDLGWAHSVEAWDDEGTLAGGLYGIAVGGLFAGESMFHRVSDASKVTLVALVDLLRAGEPADAGRVLDVQWWTPHLDSLGCVEVSRARYGELLSTALRLPLPPAFR
ncbi:MAG: leucyl/phenylalanyl-tRNA--protein transferase [Nocardioidaceae bacterium]